MVSFNIYYFTSSGALHSRYNWRTFPEDSQTNAVTTGLLANAEPGHKPPSEIRVDIINVFSEQRQLWNKFFWSSFSGLTLTGSTINV